MAKRVVQLGDDPLIDWVSEPVFEFESEVDALTMLDRLAEELDNARKQAEHTMRFLKAAVRSAGELREDGGKISAKALIDHSRLARQTVYDILDR
ncbi:hypothetical protein ACIBCH_41935 [Amycolatopsis thailandensis]|uniref:hypothetical protein n=1 Tax=Amycolatopsis thailandensis TaxID=589330 RepID=UPI0037A3E8B0